MSGSALSFSAISTELLAMVRGLSSDALVSASMLRNFPSQPKRKLSAALKTVSVLSAIAAPSGPTSCCLGLAPFVAIS